MNSFIISLFINICFSIILIYFLHQLWEYLKDQFSVKKTIDKFHFQNEKYDKIIDKLQNNLEVNNNSTVSEDPNIFEKLNQELLDFSESELLNSQTQTI